MDIETHMSLKANLHVIIKKGYETLKQIEQKYLDSITEHKKGERVELWRWGEKKGEGVVVGFEFKNENSIEIRYIICKIDNDGNTEDILWYDYWNYDEIKKIK